MRHWVICCCIIQMTINFKSYVNFFFSLEKFIQYIPRYVVSHRHHQLKFAKSKDETILFFSLSLYTDLCHIMYYVEVLKVEL